MWLFHTGLLESLEYLPLVFLRRLTLPLWRIAIRTIALSTAMASVDQVLLRHPPVCPDSIIYPEQNHVSQKRTPDMLEQINVRYKKSCNCSQNRCCIEFSWENSILVHGTTLYCDCWKLYTCRQKKSVTSETWNQSSSELLYTFRFSRVFLGGRGLNFSSILKVNFSCSEKIWFSKSHLESWVS